MRGTLLPPLPVVQQKLNASGGRTTRPPPPFLSPAEKFPGLDDFKNLRRDELRERFVAGMNLGQHFAGINLQPAGGVVLDVHDELVFDEVRVEMAQVRRTFQVFDGGQLAERFHQAAGQAGVKFFVQPVAPAHEADWQADGFLRLARGS